MITVITVVPDCSQGANKLINLGLEVKRPEIVYPSANCNSVTATQPVKYKQWAMEKQKVHVIDFKSVLNRLKNCIWVSHRYRTWYDRISVKTTETQWKSHDGDKWYVCFSSKYITEDTLSTEPVMIQRTLPQA